MAGAEPLVLVGEVIEPEKPKAAKKRAPKTAGEKTPGTRVWEAYLEAHKRVHPEAEPAGSATTASQCATLVRKLGEENAIAVVRFYVTHRRAYYVAQMHALGPCVKDCEALLMQWQTGQRITNAQANAVDKDDANREVFERVFQKLEAEAERGIA